jgi:hypothetical protein
VDVTVRFPRTVTRGSTVEVMVVITGREGIATYDEAGIDVAMNARGLWNVQVTPIGGEATSSGFTGLVGGIQTRGRRFGPGTQLGFAARFDIAANAPIHELPIQVSASLTGGRPSKSFVRNYVASVEPQR